MFLKSHLWCRPRTDFLGAGSVLLLFVVVRVDGPPNKRFCCRLLLRYVRPNFRRYFLLRVHVTIGHHKSHVVFPFSLALGLEFNSVKQTRAASVSFAFVDSHAHVYVSMFRFCQSLVCTRSFRQGTTDGVVILPFTLPYGRACSVAGSMGPMGFAFTRSVAGMLCFMRLPR